MGADAAELEYRDAGARDFPVVLLWHGGAGPEQTWAKQAVLAERWRLLVPWRRGYAPSPPCDRQDWARDADDLLRLAPAGTHLVAHSYGGVSASVAAASDPTRFASLTFIEPPLWFLAEDDARVRELAHLARIVVGPGADPASRGRFLRLAALPEDDEETARIEQRAIGLRDPGEARPALAAVRGAGVESYVVSGGHSEALECVCDALAVALGARRATLPGRGHAVQRVPAFNAHLEAFLRGDP